MSSMKILESYLKDLKDAYAKCVDEEIEDVDWLPMEDAVRELAATVYVLGDYDDDDEEKVHQGAVLVLNWGGVRIELNTLDEKLYAVNRDTGELEWLDVPSRICEAIDDALANRDI